MLQKLSARHVQWLIHSTTILHQIHYLLQKKQTYIFHINFTNTFMKNFGNSALVPKGWSILTMRTPFLNIKIILLTTKKNSKYKTYLATIWNNILLFCLYLKEPYNYCLVLSLTTFWQEYFTLNWETDEVISVIIYVIM